MGQVVKAVTIEPGEREAFPVRFSTAGCELMTFGEQCIQCRTHMAEQ